MAKQKYYKYNLITNKIEEGYLEIAEDTLILMQNPLMEFEQKFQNDEILTVQDALNFLLMGNMSLINRKGVNGMGKYLADQIYRGRLDYDEVIAKYPQFKFDIDARLESLAKKDGLKFER